MSTCLSFCSHSAVSAADFRDSGKTETRLIPVSSGMSFFPSLLTYPLEDGSGVKLKVASYFLPSGRNIHGDGLQPDVEVEMETTLRRRTDLPHNEDVQLIKAIEELGGDPLP